MFELVYVPLTEYVIISTSKYFPFPVSKCPSKRLVTLKTAGLSNVQNDGRDTSGPG